MLQSKPIILDTSTWIRYIDSNRFHKTIEQYYLNGFFPFFTLHNLKELINTNDDELRKKRLIQISTIEHLYNFSDIQTPASIINLCVYEFKFFLDTMEENDYYDKLKAYINSKLTIISGRELISDLDLFTVELNNAANTNREGLFFASVPPQLHHEGIKSKQIKLKNIDLGKLSRSYFDEKKRKIIQVLHQKGDKKKQHLSDDVDKLLESRFNSLLNNSTNDKLTYFAEAAGLNINEISLEMTFEDYLNIIERNGKLRVIAKCLGVEFDDVLNVDIKYIPTFRFDEVFQDYYQSKIINDIPRRAESSIIEDRYLASFSMYFDVIVDKRTYEVLQGIQENIPCKLNFHKNKLNNIIDFA